MKYTYMSRIKNTLATASFAFVAILAFSIITSSQVALADSQYNYDGWGGLDSYDYSDYTSPSSYDYSGWGGLDSYDYSYPSYSSYTPSYSSGYSYTPSYGGGYSYTPTPSYFYVPYTSGSGGGAGIQYVSSSNTNANANTNTITNTFNPTNNNDAKINLIVYGGGGSTNNNSQALDGSCTINPSTANVNQNVTFNASATGGNGSYSYSWSGDNGMYSNAQSFTGQYSYSGYKTATVTITSNGQSVTRTCGVNIQNTYNGNNGAYCIANPTNAGVGQGVTWTAYPGNNNGSYYGNYSYSWTGTDNMNGSGQSVTTTYGNPGYKTATVTMYGNGQTITATCNTNIGGVLGTQSNVTVLRDQNLGTPVSGVFLSQVPDTGISFGLKMTLFSIGLILWSVFAAYMIARRKNSSAELAHANGANSNSGTSSNDKVAAFKLANMQKKGIQG